MDQNITLRVTWHRITDTYLYPEKWWDSVSRIDSWRAAVHIDGQVSSLVSMDVEGLTLGFDWQAGLSKWSRINQVDCIEETATGILVWLPRIAEPEDDIFVATMVTAADTWELQTVVPPCPTIHKDTSILESHVTWEDGEPILNIRSPNTITAQWRHQRDGVWHKDYLCESLNPGSHAQPFTVPFSEVVYLEIESSVQGIPVRHRYYAVGRPGISSGRYVWYRGTMYAPKVTRSLPWVSVIAPVMHPDDIERVPAFVKWNQVEWWIYPGTWADEAVDIIKTKFPRAGLIRLGKLGDSSADIQVLRPMEVQAENLEPQVRYTVSLFDDAGDTEFARRAGWFMDRLVRDDIKEYRFIERSWRQGLTPQNPVDGLPQYGFGFAFTRPPEHEYIWPAAQRDVDWRENKENFPCHKCKHRATCRQALPMPYATDDARRLPWIALDRNNCPLPQWFSRESDS